MKIKKWEKNNSDEYYRIADSGKVASVVEKDNVFFAKYKLKQNPTFLSEIFQRKTFHNIWFAILWIDIGLIEEYGKDNIKDIFIH